MPIAKSLKKIEQKLKKKSAVHPKARKFKQLNRATLREAKITKRQTDREMARDGQGKLKGAWHVYDTDMSSFKDEVH
ncbi:hypothetical protein V1525DRAFT_396795 [Lipomyces kononenkoae]|uniref:Uncharacterized protein n=1 Tax=Lipomyces kononenkoae TaxID=34357 RepID=A0ACC3T797_LIPKO